MTKTKFQYAATFSDGTVITRKSNRVYAFAWIVRWANPYTGSETRKGFAATRAGAEREFLSLSRVGRSIFAEVVPVAERVGHETH